MDVGPWSTEGTRVELIFGVLQSGQAEGTTGALPVC